MKYRYSTMTRTLLVIGAHMNHQFDNVNPSEIETCLVNVKLKEATWRK